VPDPSQPVKDDAEARKQKAQQLDEYRAYAASRPNTSMTDDEKVEYMKSRSKTAKRDMFTKPEYDPEAVNEMIARKDQAALHQTGSTSGTRTAQKVGRGAKTTQEVASSIGGEFVDKATGLPIASTVDALALGTEATTMKMAMNDPRRKEKARTTQATAAEMHEQGHDAVKVLRSDLEEFHKSGGTTPSDSSPRLETGSGLAAFKAAGETVRAHNNARRAAIASGGVNDLIQPMSMDHTLGDEVATIGGKAVVDDGTKIDSSYTAAVRQKKDVRKGEIKQGKQELKDRQAARQRGEADAEFDTHMQGLAAEKAQHGAELDTLKQAQKSRDRLGRTVAGYKLTDQELADQKAAKGEVARLDKQISTAHDTHVAGLTESLTALEATGRQQKEADRNRGRTSIFSSKQRFSKKDEMATLEAQRDAIRATQTSKIQTKLDGATAALASTTDPRRKQMIQDQIAMHKEHLAKSKSDPTFVARQHLGADDRAKLQDTLSQLGTLQREKDTGLTADQQKEHDRIRASIDAAKQGGTAGASAEDLKAREEHQASLANFDNLSKHGLTLEQSERKATLKKRMASINKTEKTKLTEQERADLAGLVSERKQLKGMNKKAAKFEKTHRDETVSMGRVGGVGTDHNEARDITSTSDSIASSINKGASKLHGAGEIVEGDLDKGREALAKGDATKAQLIAGSKVGQNVAGIVGGALGVEGIDSAIEKVGQGMQGAGNLIGGATYEAANRALFAKNARSMIEDDQGKTGRFHEVNTGVIDFHGADAEAFGKGGVTEGAKQLASVLHEPLSDAFGDDVSKALSPVTNAVQEHVLDPASAGLQQHVLDPATKALAPVTDAISEAPKALHENVIQPASQALGDAGQAIGDAGQAVHENVIKPAGQAMGDAGQAVHENVIKPAGQALQQHVLDPIAEPLAPVTEAVGGAAAAVHENVIQPASQALQQHVLDPAMQALAPGDGDSGSSLDSAVGAVKEHVVDPSVAAAQEMAQEKGQEAVQEKAMEMWANRDAPEERTDPKPDTKPAAPSTGPTPAPAPTPAPGPAPGPKPGPTPPGPTPAPPAKKLSWWQRAVRAVKRGVSAVGRGVSRGWNRLKGLFSRSSP